MIKTPLLSHLSYRDYEHIYEPAEDSFLLLDALEKDLSDISASKPAICLEVGCGSGIISTGLASVLPGCAFLATDVNPRACAASAETARINNGGASVFQPVRTNTVDGLAHRLAGKVDVLLCNPPYVATEEAEASGRALSAAWAGGSAGRLVTDAVLRALPSLLVRGSGRCYMVVEQCNQPERVVQLAEEIGLVTEQVLKRRAGRELLYVFKFFVPEACKETL